MCVKINEKQFVLRIIAQDNNSIKPGFISETEPKHQIHSSISAAINIIYKKLFKKTKTKYSGLNVLGLEEDEIIEELLSEETYFDVSPEEVWEKINACRGIDPMALFGLADSAVKDAMKKQMQVPLCNFKQWADLDIMMPIFKKYLKRRIGISDLPWHEFFIKWLNQKSSIIELTAALESIYPSNYKFGIHEFRAWKQMMKIVGCTNITPFSKNTSQLELY
ncbi:hypothetical protein GLOIN_2v1535567 [Rhizophagus clarus]|uniref:Uncharacterized protein n=1 Tax=Rhizophagus clarus TaxID=94130 RepID=A0A8H3LYL0_9GLOM|nr:hypothetical protein GLOIN_2v1535567 [Rhizophagus clarus]